MPAIADSPSSIDGTLMNGPHHRSHRGGQGFLHHPGLDHAAFGRARIGHLRHRNGDPLGQVFPPAGSGRRSGKPQHIQVITGVDPWVNGGIWSRRCDISRTRRWTRSTALLAR